MSGSEFPRGLKGVSAEEAQQLLERGKISARDKLDDVIGRGRAVSSERLEKLGNQAAQFVKPHQSWIQRLLSKISPARFVRGIKEIFHKRAWKGSNVSSIQQPQPSVAPVAPRQPKSKKKAGLMQATEKLEEQAKKHLNLVQQAAPPKNLRKRAKSGAKTTGAVRADVTVSKEGFLARAGKALAPYIRRGLSPHRSPNE